MFSRRIVWSFAAIALLLLGAMPASAATSLSGETVTGAPNLAGGITPPTHATCVGSNVNIGYQVINQPAAGPVPGFVSEFGTITVTNGIVTNWRVNNAWSVAAVPAGEPLETATMNLGQNTGTSNVGCSGGNSSGTVSAALDYTAQGSFADFGLVYITLTFNTSTRSGSFFEQFGVNTPVGASIVNAPPATLTFSGVTAAGLTTSSQGSTGPIIPANFTVGNPPTYYFISTTAVFATVTVCITDATVTATSRLLHFDASGNATDVTASVSGQQICSIPLTSLSPFIVAQPSSTGGGGGGTGGNPSPPGATPELDSLLLFASGVSGLGGYAMLRLRHRRAR